MSDERQKLLDEISALEQAIAALAALPDMRTPLETQLAEKRQRLAALGAQSGGVNLGTGNTFEKIDDVFSGDKVMGDKVMGDKVLGDKIIQLIFGPNPTDKQREQLQRFLQRLAAKMKRLPLAGLAPSLDDGEGVALPQVYVMLATEGRVIIEPDEEVFEKNRTEQILKRQYSPEWVLPDKAILNTPGIVGWDSRITSEQMLLMRERVTNNAVRLISRALLATETVHDQQYLVLVGDPGGGKSTFLRHLAWALAQRGLGLQGQATTLFGWNDATVYLPLLLPLRTLAGRLATDGVKPATVFATLRDELVSNYTVRDADTLLEHALDNDAALLLFDGLDEVPLESTADVADRMTTLQAVRAFIEVHTTARVLITCRVRAFDEALRACLGWPVETLAPFTLGQMRHFIAAWYDELVRRGSLSRDQADKQHSEIITALTDPKRSRLREMGQTPLLLTMMALVRAEKGELPRDRALLYERILEQLLGAWDQGRGGQTLAQVVGDQRVQSDTLRPLFDQLCYEAHLHATSQDGHGRLASDDLQLALIKFFKQIKVQGAAEAADRCIDYFHERSGLLLPEDQQNTFAFAHLTLQEQGAGRYMLLGSHGNAVQMVMQHRSEDRWREPIALGLGVIHTTQPSAADRVDRVLTELISRHELGEQHMRGKLKDRVRWYRDLLFAAELGYERDWDLLRPLGIGVDRLQDGLRDGLMALLRDSTQPQLTIAERIYAGQVLGKLDDPRFPIAPAQWQMETERRSEVFGKPNGYWCYMPQRSYQIGGWGEGESSAEIELPHFWVARLPVTVAQFTPFVAEGYSAEAETYWTENGKQWRKGRTQPYLWNSPQTQPNQPVVGVTWYEATAFCEWLTVQLGTTLPEGYEVRLPTEAEWEAAATFDGTARRTHPWGNDQESTPDLAIYNAAKLDARAPVGCCLAGMAACGTLDIVGNVWEWASSNHTSYPQDSGLQEKDFTQGKFAVPLRGAAYYSNSTSVRCGARNRNHPIDWDSGVGFRVVVAGRCVC